MSENDNLDLKAIERLLDIRDRRDFKRELDACTETDYKFRQICGDYYKVMEPLIIQGRGRFDIYDLGDSIIRRMTPIEKEFFMDTRIIGNCQLFPQYPVGKYFLDFGNPFHKIGVECDGKDFHDRDKDRDRDKDIYLSHGWIIFRLGGDACYRGFENEQDKVQEKIIDELRYNPEASYHDLEIRHLVNYMEGYGDALIRVLRYAYFENRTHSKELRAEFEMERRDKFGL